MSEWTTLALGWTPPASWDRVIAGRPGDRHHHGLGARAAVPRVGGRAFIAGRNELFLDPEDPLVTGFLPR